MTTLKDKPLLARWVTMVTTLGFSLQGELAHHHQGQSPILKLVGFLFSRHLPQTQEQNSTLTRGPQWFEKS